MLEHRGLHRNSVITGSNQRIERLWRDLHSCVTKLYYRLLDHGLLDHTNQICLYALEYVYKPRINRSLEQFVQGWNNHSIRTEHHHSPRQLFSSGVLRLQHSGLVALDFMDAVDSQYGVDDSSPAPIDAASDGVNVPEINIRASEHVLTPATPNHGIELYEQALSILST